MKHLLYGLLAAALLLTAACTPNDKTTTTDSTTASAADTAGASRSLSQDKAGVQLDSAGSRLSDGTGGASSNSAPGATSPQGQ